MTYAPACIKAARAYLMSRGVPGASLGIVGDAAHKSSGGYHCGNDWLSDVGRLYSDYSKRQSGRDRPGSNAAMALDIGGLSDNALYALSSWIVAQCQAGAPWTADIREVIYWHKPSNTIRRWDRLGLASGGSWSHRTHTHISYHRDSEGRDKTMLFRLYFEGGAPSGEDMTAEERNWLLNVYTALFAGGVSMGTPVTPVNTNSAGNAVVDLLQHLRREVDALKAGTGAPAPVAVDASAVAAALAGNADFLSAVAKAVNDDAHRRSAE